MDNAALVDEWMKVVTAVRREKGHVALFMLTAIDPGMEQAWNLIVSAEGYDQSPAGEALKHLVNIVRENISVEHLRSLKRATVLKTSDPFVRSINQAFSVKSSTVRIQSSTFSGIFIESAILLESQSPPEKTGIEKTRKVAHKKNA
jgi:hypothetical protein